MSGPYPQQQGKPIPPQMMEPPPPYTAQPGIHGQPPPPGFVASHYPAQSHYPAPGATITTQGAGNLHCVHGPSITFGATPLVFQQAVAANPGGAVTATVIVRQGFGPYPMQVTCTNCNASVMTETSASPGLLTWLLSGTLLLVGCWLGCCLIPCCIPECQDIEHRCPNCKIHIGTYRRL